MAAFLLLTAGLKVWPFLMQPFSHPRPDFVFAILTNREVILLAVIFEVFVAVALFQSANAWKSASLVMYFVVCASIYQLGLIFQSDPPCACLGVASEWFDSPKLPSLIIRAALSFLFVGSLLLLFKLHNVTANKATQGPSAVNLTVLLLLGLLPPASSSVLVAATIVAQGEYVGQFEHKTPRGTHYEEVKYDFGALLDRQTLKITYSQKGSGPYDLSGRCTNTVFINDVSFATVFQCEDMDSANVVLGRIEYPRDLGICGIGVQNSVFLTLRCLDFFSRTGSTRRIALPWTIPGEPLSLITEAHYSYSEEPTGPLLNGKIIVAGALRREWLASVLLAPGFNKTVDLRREEANLSPYQVGFEVAEFEFANFTNIAGVHIPTLARFVKYDLMGSRNPSRPSGTQAIVIRGVKETDDTISILPVSARRVFVQDERLFSQKYRITDGFFETNFLGSLQIAAQAKNDFAGRLQRARDEERAVRIRQLFTVVLMIAIVVGGLAVYYGARLRARRAESK